MRSLQWYKRGAAYHQTQQNSLGKCEDLGKKSLGKCENLSKTPSKNVINILKTPSKNVIFLS